MPYIMRNRMAAYIIHQCIESVNMNNMLSIRVGIKAHAN